MLHSSSYSLQCKGKQEWSFLQTLDQDQLVSAVVWLRSTQFVIEIDCYRFWIEKKEDLWQYSSIFVLFFDNYEVGMFHWISSVL